MEISVRPLVIEDAAALHEAVVESIEHLRPWMPWVADEPISLEQRVEWIRTATDVLGIFADGRCVGGTGLHDRVAPSGREIGYWVRSDSTGRGVATAAVRLVVERAFTLPGIDHVEIHHDKANAASARIPAKLGFTLIREVGDEIAAPGECGVSCEWRLHKTATPHGRDRSTATSGNVSGEP